VQPIFKEHCYSCHGPNKQEAAFRLDHKPSALKGGDFGSAILPGKSADSPLVHAIEGTEPEDAHAAQRRSAFGGADRHVKALDR
jgi:mono/diheme cytochrome c family protein